MTCITPWLSVNLVASGFDAVFVGFFSSSLGVEGFRCEISAVLVHVGKWVFSGNMKLLCDCILVNGPDFQLM